MGMAQRRGKAYLQFVDSRRQQDAVTIVNSFKTPPPNS